MSKRPTFDKAFIDGIHAVLNGADPAATATQIKQAHAANDNAANNEKEKVMSATAKETIGKKSSTPAAKPAAAKPAAKPAAKKEDAKTTAPTREQIIACATDMNDKMGLDPAINVKLATQAIARDIMKNAADLDFSDYDGSKKADEQITDDTKATLATLGFKTPEAPAPAPAADGKKSSKKAPAPAKKVKSSKEMKAEREAAKANKPAPAPKYTRTNAFNDAIKKCAKGKGCNFEKILSTVNELYAKHGHDDAATNDNAKKSRLLMVLESLVAFDVLVLKDGIYSFKL